MKGRLAGVALAALTVAMVDADAQAAAPRLLVRNAAAHVEIVAEDRADIVATVTPANGAGLRLPALEVRTEGGNLIVDGKLRNRIRSCDGGGAMRRARTIQVTGVGKVSASELPTIQVRAPRVLAAEIASAGRVTVGATQSADLAFEGCGDAVVGPVTGDLRVSLDGSGDVDFGAVGGRLDAQLDGSGDIRGGDAAGVARLGLDGSGDLQVGALRGGLTAELDGSGDIVVASATGPVSLSLDGSGDLVVRAGTAPQLVARLDGSGDIAFLGVAGDADLAIDDSGDIRVARATGTVRKSTDGSGEVSVGQ